MKPEGAVSKPNTFPMMPLNIPFDASSKAFVDEAMLELGGAHKGQYKV